MLNGKTAGPRGGSAGAFAVIGTNLFSGIDYQVFLSTDGGTSWTSTNSGFNGFVNSLAVSGTNLFAGTLGGIYLSTDNGVSWTAKNNGITDMSIYSMAVLGTKLFAESDLTIYRSTDNGSSWVAILPESDITCFGVAGSALYVGVLPAAGSQLFQSTDDGASWHESDSGLPKGLNGSVSCILARGNDIFAGTDNGAVFMSLIMGAVGMGTV